MTDTPLKFPASPSGEVVSALLRVPEKTIATLILGHGAGANMYHAHMEAIAAALAERDIATLRFNFPFMENAKRRTDNKDVCLQTIGNALALVHEQLPQDAVYLGGHSFGGRMASHYCAENPGMSIAGLVCYSFPLHPAKKPDDKRAAHFRDIDVPVLFVSGTRDALADPRLFESAVDDINDARTHWLDTADHGFKILKRSRQSAEDVYSEAARVTRQWIQSAKSSG